MIGVGWVGRITALVGGALAVAACGGGGGDGGSRSLDFLIEHNAREGDGFTVRFPNLPIRVFTAGIAQQSEVTEWTTVTGGLVTFTFVDSRSSADVTFRFGGGPGICGVTTIEFEVDGPRTRILNSDVEVVRDAFRGAQCVRTVTHEVAHAIGFLGHTADGGLMDDDGGNGEITQPVIQLFLDLYSMAPGTFVGLAERMRQALRTGGGRRVIRIVDPTR